jgi:endonuclease/exonuclease/phosphatase family metal-dependent hydrolase
MSKQKPDKQKMATIMEVYNRIVWDTRLNRNLFIAGFHERVSDTIREKPLAQWDERGDIPWHRVRYIRCGDVVVWDREERIDLISIDKLPVVAWKLDNLEPNQTDLAALLANHQVEFTQRTVYKYNAGWQEFIGAVASVSIDTLTIASYNVLIDVHHSEQIQTQKRLPVILDRLRKTDADIIALQEVTPALVDLLLKTDWVRDYFISESEYASKVKPYGNLIMSRLPFKLVEHQFSGHKRSLVGSWQLNDKLVHLANVHLTSNHGENSFQKRTQQLATVLSHLQHQSGECLIVGDFNTRGDEQQESIDYAKFVDLWQQLHPDEDGYTFDPHRNPLAMLMSLEGEPARFDRILFRQGIESHYQPISIELFGCEPVDDTNEQIYPSDHFGVRGELKFVANRSSAIGLGKTLSKFAPCTGELRAIIDRLEPELTPVEQLRRETVLAIVKQACSDCLGFEASLLLLGSARLGVESLDSDLDAICLIPNYVTGKKFLVRVEDCLQGLCDRSLVVVDARFPVLRLTIEGISLDLLYTQVEVTGEWENLSSQELKARIKNPKAIVGCWEADLMVDLVSQHVPVESFRWLLKAVRAWAKSRGIYGNSWGFLGGFSWSLLCAWSCVQYQGQDRSTESLLANFFQLLNQHDWSKAISLTEVGRQYQVKLPTDRLPIITSIEPCKNTARNITRSTAQIFQNEFTRGAKILANNNAWTALFEPIDLAINSTDLLKITAVSHNIQELEIFCGILEGCIIALAIQLEQHDIFVRLSPKPEISENTASIMLFLNSPVGCELSLVDRLGRDFISQLKGIGNDVEVGLSFIGSVKAIARNIIHKKSELSISIGEKRQSNSDY